jgi:error-prone DNA polymerase
VAYAELHCRSNFSFLTGASHPEALVDEAARLEVAALALTDRDGFYGVVRFAQAARGTGIGTVFGVEVSLAEIGGNIVLLAQGPSGYARLSRAISVAQLAGSKGAPKFSLRMLADECSGHVAILTGADEGAIPRSLRDRGPAEAERALSLLVDSFGADSVWVELWDHGTPMCSARNDALVRSAALIGIPVLATNDVHYATPSDHRLANVFAAVRAGSALTEHDSWLPAGSTAHLRSAREQLRRFARYPGAVENAAELGAALAFDLSLLAPNLPPYPCPDGLNEMQYLRRVVHESATKKYGPPPSDPLEDLTLRARAWRAIEHELNVIEALGFPGYFLVVWDIVEFCRHQNIYCQGRGSAANSAVCYSLGITNADPVSLGLLFERFLSPERDGPPDIDVDIESARREEAIQYVFNRYGRHHAAQVANVITYRSKSAVRDVLKAVGEESASKNADIVNEMISQIADSPRHLGIHSGGMVICDRPVIEVCPVEWARMRNRSVLQWDKDDCAAAGLVKFDLLGLGMLTALHKVVDLVREHHGVEVDLATIPQDDEVYAMLCRADTVGVFQVESRAQMITLPRLRPRRFYDIVVEVALIRPGPIQGGSVHPYIRRRNGEEPVTYLHPLLEKSLAKTLGVPLFQEQLMQMAIDVANFTPNEADLLRQAMGSKRSTARMEAIKQRLYEGMYENGVSKEVADEIFNKMAAFANYGFPESHSVSFAYLVYASAWFKRFYPAAFCVALLNSQPMGFWSPHSLVQDAKRHGIQIRPVDVNHSRAVASLEPCDESVGGFAVRIGFDSVRGVGTELAQLIASAAPYLDAGDLRHRVPGINKTHLENLSAANAFASCGVERREAIWQAGVIAKVDPAHLPGTMLGAETPDLPEMNAMEKVIADLSYTGVSPDVHPIALVREYLDTVGVLRSVDLHSVRSGSRVIVGGIVTHRQRPATAKGTTFINLEDETGLINILCSRGCWKRFQDVAVGATAMIVRGRLESVKGAINVIAEHLEHMPVAMVNASRDFH